MSDTQNAAPTPVEQATAAQEQVQLHLQKLQRQQRELQTLIRQIDTEVQPLTTRKSERADLVRAIEANPAAYPPPSVREAYDALSDASIRLYMMQTQLDSLRQREQWLGAQQVALQEYASSLDELAQTLAALPTAPPAGTGAYSPANDDLSTSELARRVVQAREEQSRWLAQHLQEGPVQTLTNLVLQAEVSHRMLARDPKKAGDEVQNLKASLARTLGDARHFIAELHPPALSEMGLRSTLRRYVADLGTRTGRKIALELPGQDRQLASEVEIALYRIAQEGLAWALSATTTPIDLCLAIEFDNVHFSLHAPGPVEVVPEASTIRSRLTLYAQAVGAQVEIHESGDRLDITLALRLTE